MAQTTTKPFEVTVRYEEKLPVFEPNEHTGDSSKYRTHDILSYYSLPHKVDPNECLPRNGLPAYPSQKVFKTYGQAGKWVVTSPNADFVPEVPIGYRVVRAKKNGKYGLDDRIQHPQFLCRDFEWMACIPRPTDERRMLYWVPTPDDAPRVEKTVLAVDARILSFKHVELLRKELKLASKLAFDVLALHPKATLLSLLASYASKCIDRLAYFGANYGTLIVTVGDFQRSCLDIYGISTYFKVIHPRRMVKSQDELDKVWPVDHSMMGGFTHSFEEAQEFHKLGIPVWWVRADIDVNLNDTKVFKNARITKPWVWERTVVAEYLPFATTKPIFEPIYEGFPGTNLQYSLQRIASRITDVVESSKVSLQRIAEKKNLAPVTRPVQHVSLYSLPPASAPTSTSSSFDSTTTGVTAVPAASLVLTNLSSDPLPAPNVWRPPIIPVWADAATAASIRLKPGVKSDHFYGFRVPEPSLITTASSDYRAAVYCIAYMALRSAHLYNLAPSDDATRVDEETGQVTARLTVPAITKNQWREELSSIMSLLSPIAKVNDSSEGLGVQHGLQLGHSSGSSSSPSVAPSNRISTSTSSSLPPAPHPSLPARPSFTAQKRPAPSSEPVQNKKAKRRSEYLKSFAVNEKLESLEWFEQTIQFGTSQDILQAISPDVGAEIVWELTEVNFRFDLLACDQVLAPHKWPSSHGLAPEDARAAERQRAERDLRVQMVFLDIGENVSEFLPSCIPNNDMGLAAWNWHHRYPFLVLMHGLMLDWEGVPASLREISTACTESATKKLEHVVAHTYCQMYAKTFARAPIVPCRLPYRARMREVPARTFGAALGSSSS